MSLTTEIILRLRERSERTIVSGERAIVPAWTVVLLCHEILAARKMRDYMTQVEENLSSENTVIGSGAFVANQTLVKQYDNAREGINSDNGK